VEEPIHVAFELEHAAVVGANALEYAVAVQQPVIEYADRRVGGGPESAGHVHQLAHTGSLLCGYNGLVSCPTQPRCLPNIDGTLAMKKSQSSLGLIHAL